MANAERPGKAAKVPSRAASLQRMLEIERKQKMERMQLQTPNNPPPASGRRGVSPASQTSSSASSRASGILNRKRDSSQSRQSLPDDRRTSTALNITLPPLSIHTQPQKRVSLMPDLTSANLSELKIQKPQEPRKPDRNTLPSMVRAATAGHEPSSLKMVAYAAEEENQSESSSICHSPTWEDHGKKKRKKQKEKEKKELEKKELEAKRKRLTKEPRPAAMDKPAMMPRAVSDTTLTIQQLRMSLESGNSSPQTASPQIATASTDGALPIPAVETVPRSPGFIGGVRLEREREAANKRMANSRGPSVERRPASEVMLRSSSSMDHDLNNTEKRRDAVATISYPPVSSKSRPPMRARRNSMTLSIITAAGKLFNSKDKDAKDRSDSRASVETDGSPDRGRKMSGSTVTYSRGHSYDAQDRFSPNKEDRKSGPPAAWKNTLRKNRTTSMMAVPPDSARDGSFSPFHSPELKTDNFDFLDHPFSPATTDPPASPAGVLSASVKGKSSPSPTPTLPATQPTPAKKTFKEALRAGFRSSGSATREAKSGRRRSGTLDTLVGSEVEDSSPRRHSQPLQSYSAAGGNSPALTRQGASPTEAPRIGQAQSGDSKDSRASSASSHPDSESQTASPMTTPEGSRPQSKKDNEAFRLEEVKRPPPLSYENVIAMRGSPTLPPRSSTYWQVKQVETPKPSVENPMEAPNDIMGRQQGQSSSDFIQELPPSQGFLTDESWTGPRKPLDPDQLSFTSALTSLDVKRSFADLRAPLQSPNGDVTPLSLEGASGGTVKKTGTEAVSAPLGFQFGLPSKTSAVASSPASSHHASPSGFQGRIPSNETSQRSSLAWRNKPAQPVRKPSDYLEEARKSVPASRPPITSPTVQTTISTQTNSGPRTFALNTSKTQTVTTRTTTVASPLAPKPLSLPHKEQQQVQSRPTPAVAAESPLGTPISKMLVECCHCKFYHDMPSRLYEAMARPDDVVKDKELGVSGQVTTCVKCPWCSHNMSTVCCAGYAAVVYLREKLHGP